MLQSQMNWNFTYKDNQKVKQTDEALDILSLLLTNRGFTESFEMEQFLNPNLDHLYDPKQLDGLEKTKQRIDLAIEQGESILVFGDYDADGVTATTLLVETLHELGAMCDYYIPNRFTEGYGPNPQAFREAKRQGFDLIITVDTGIAAFESAKVAKELNMDLIITDHHEVQDKLPEAYAIIHPKLSKDYPFKELAGVGVAFKIAHYLLGYLPKQFLDLVAIGTVADLVPLIDENRILVKFGLESLANSKRPGIVALKEVAAIKGIVDEQDVGFAIGPRLNAAGRLESAYPAVELLLTSEMEEGQRLATEIDLINQERQRIVNQIVEEAIELVNLNEKDNQFVIVVAKEGWNEGVLGIVASKLVRIYQRPAICLTLKQDEQIAKGSGRSIAAFDLFGNGMELHDQFIQFGGHAQAIGMTLKIDRVDRVRESLNQLANQKLQSEDYKEQVNLELELNLKDLKLETIKKINQLAPFGMANPKPIFYVKGKPLDLKQIGTEKNHLKFNLEQDDYQLASVGFGFGDQINRMTSNDHLEVIGHLQINEWNGKQSPQLIIKDFRIKERQLFDYRGSKFWHKQVQHLMDKEYLAVSFQKLTARDDLDITPIAQTKEQNLGQITELLLIDLPSQLSDLSALLSKTKPNNIYACYSLDEKNNWPTLPTRDDFKWFYGYLIKYGKYDHKHEQNKIINYKGWNNKKIEFIINVFYELKFVKIDNKVIYLNEEAEKRDLSESIFYQNRLKQREIQELLYYTNYQELKTWMMNQIE
ncbi:single-stranded-DNA-specific exonuclease RecJ [Amphibacillus sp. MSJ-3]|uniref:single-stranded-DNA-specific exonuclease RecJ n=1 Tax=Amphibacillus sp. MSJ-3 TaxID=2841505 RepID=UPI001C0EAC9A|nr:single-stranded-DNA-specific exonuclease RecJ [Amphibacillus sp. MSJ-3]MBU5593568.1 single-stranded-DNA-specific exonuclease RecJ [Amphibacillus sp. MSJ-3]